MAFKLNNPTTDIQDRYFLTVNHINNTVLALEQSNVCYFVLSQNSKLTASSIVATGIYAAVVESGIIDGSAVVIKMPGVKRPNIVAAVDPASPGDLSYIDGCSNSVLATPPRNGDPCLNYLYFPSGIDQTFHTHPSLRIGVIVNGNGFAEYFEDGKLRVTTLKTGDSFVLDRHVKHRFRTEDSIMSIIVFHPDSDDGPKDEFNPMKSRTYSK